MRSDSLLRRALDLKLAIPAFNIPYLPMMEPVIAAVKDEDTVAIIAVARLEWEKFESGGIEPIYREFTRLRDSDHVRLHLDHVPVIDEDDERVDYGPIIRRAIDLGYESVMIDGSRLPFAENVEITRRICESAHERDIPVEAELGAVLGHEASPSMSYDEIVATKAGFTNPDEAERFVRETGCDWLSIAFGNIHGAISEALRDQKKVAGRFDVEHLDAVYSRIGIPIVLHGGSGVTTDVLHAAIAHGIAKVNVGTDIRQEHEREIRGGSLEKAREAVYERTRTLIRDHFRMSGTRTALLAGPDAG